MSIALKNVFIDNSPGQYIPSDELKQAAEVAYALKRPLLLSGEPGTGKTDFARWLAFNLQKDTFAPEPIIYTAKSSSDAQDLFYHYDAVAHFRETNTNTSRPGMPVANARSTEDFIQLKGLGLAFANALGKNDKQLNQSIANRSEVSGTPIGSVVLIDEIDKAPRDFPNDLLSELERYKFEIKEINSSIQLTEEDRQKILIILTSNFEKSLPEPFLRRCVYFHIDFPDEDALLRIISNRLRISGDDVDKVRARITDFFVLRENKDIQKKPSTAEFIDWIRILKDRGLLGSPLYGAGKKLQQALISYMPILLKRKEDLELFRLK